MVLQKNNHILNRFNKKIYMLSLRSMKKYSVEVPVVSKHVNLGPVGRAVAPVHPRTARSTLYADLGLGCEGPQACHRKVECGHGTGPWQRLGGRRFRGQKEPTGRRRAGRPREYSPVGREGIRTSLVVQGKGVRSMKKYSVEVPVVSKHVNLGEL